VGVGGGWEGTNSGQALFVRLNVRVFPRGPISVCDWSRLLGAEKRVLVSVTFRY